MSERFLSLPQHVAVIMDGNGRWAERQGLPRSHGHAKGVEVLRKVLEYCEEFGINYLTAYAFSTENWQRSREEVDALMSLLAEYLQSEVEKLKKQQVALRVIGNIADLPDDVGRKLDSAIAELGQYNFKRTLTLALSYGARDEIVRAVKKISAASVESENIDENLISSYLDTAGMPDPDFLIRTAGELRLSNFMLWQLSYAELYATKTLWPDFSKEDFINALRDYELRVRKFGKVSERDNLEN